MSEMSAEREAELRAAGWTDHEVADFRVGYEHALEAMKAPPLPAPAPPSEGPGWFAVADHFPQASERGRWQRETFAGALSRLLSPPDDAAELAEAGRMQDHREYVYGNRPDLGTCLVATRHSGRRGVTVSGSTAEVAQIFRNAGIGVVVSESFDPPSTAAPPKILRV